MRAPVSKNKILVAGVFFLQVFSFYSPEGRTATSSSTGAVTISASVPSALTLNLTIIDPLTQSAVPTMDFNELERVGEEFRAAKFFKVFLEVDTVGDPLTLTQVGTPITRTGGSETIPSGAYVVDPTYSEADNNGKAQAPGSQLAARQSVVGTHEIYNDPNGAKRTLTIFYYLSGDPATGGTQIIPLDQKSGAYSGSIQFTLTSS